MINKDFTRGGQIILHAVRMFLQVAGKFFQFLILFALILTASIWYNNTSEANRYYSAKWLEAKSHTIVGNNNALIDIVLARTNHKFTSGHIVNNTVFKGHFNTTVDKLIYAAIFSILACLTLSLVAATWLIKKGKTQLKKDHLRGALRCKPDELKKMLKKNKVASDLELAGMPLAKNVEVQHFLITGTTGSGKSVCMHELLEQARNKKQRAVVYDLEGEFIPTYFREGKDILLNPVDERSSIWNIWQEGNLLPNFETLAASLMPLHLAGTDPFWIHSARTIFSTAAYKLQQQGNLSTRSLLDQLFSEDLSSLQHLLKGTAAETLVSKDIEKVGLSIKSTLSTYCKALEYLPDDSNGANFSIKQWLERDDDSWLFIASNPTFHEALRPLITMLLDATVNATLGLETNLDRRIWLFLDELNSLNQLPSLTHAAERGRKKGLCLALGLQSVNQLKATYGSAIASTLVSLCNTKVCFKTTGESAKWVASLFGNNEILETREGVSYGAHQMRDGVNLQNHKMTETLVMPSEIAQLPNLEAFLQFDAWPVTKVKFNYKSRERLYPALKQRDLSEINMTSTIVSEKLEQGLQDIEKQPNRNKSKKRKGKSDKGKDEDRSTW